MKPITDEQRAQLLALCDDAKRFTPVALANRVLESLGVSVDEVCEAWGYVHKTKAPRHPTESQIWQYEAPNTAKTLHVIEQKWLSTPEMARRLGCSPQSLRLWAELDGETAPVSRYGSRWIWQEYETVAWAKARTRKRTEARKLRSLAAGAEDRDAA